MAEREIGQAEAVELLRAGELDVLGRMPWSSNQTFLAKVERGGVEALVIYKPRRGERPLWDFPNGSLCRRELAAFARAGFERRAAEAVLACADEAAVAALLGD